MGSSILTQAKVALDQSHGTQRPSTSHAGSLQTSGTTGSAKNLKQVQKAAQDFEAVFISQMLKPMFEGLNTDGLFGGGKGEEMFKSFLVDEYGKTIARSGGLGISGAVMKTMLSAQEEHRK